MIVNFTMESHETYYNYEYLVLTAALIVFMSIFLK